MRSRVASTATSRLKSPSGWLANFPRPVATLRAEVRLLTEPLVRIEPRADPAGVQVEEPGICQRPQRCQRHRHQRSPSALSHHDRQARRTRNTRRARARPGAWPRPPQQQHQPAANAHRPGRGGRPPLRPRTVPPCRPSTRRTRRERTPTEQPRAAPSPNLPHARRASRRQWSWPARRAGSRSGPHPMATGRSPPAPTG